MEFSESSPLLPSSLMSEMAVAEDADDPRPPPSFAKLSVSGTVLASLIQRFASSLGDIDGLLFGHVTRLPPPEPRDDDADPSPSSAVSPVVATITGYLSLGPPTTFFDPLARLDLSGIEQHSSAASDGILGWFSGRRRSPLRPSMRERSVSLSLFKALTLGGDHQRGFPDPSGDARPLLRPSVFLLLSSSTTANQAVHTHEYRAFVFRPKADAGGSCMLEPRSLDVVNVGPAFRGQYSSFSPESAFPWVPCQTRVQEVEAEARNGRPESLASEQQSLDSLVKGFGMERLGRMAGPGASAYASELEGLYGAMLKKLESLAGLVETSSAMVLEQEKHNLELRNKVAGLK